MKLRQKLAMVLATAMIVTAVPVVTFADSTNRVNKTVSSIDGTKVKATDNVKIIMDFGTSLGDDNVQKTTFYINGQDFDLDMDWYKANAEMTNELTTSEGYKVPAKITFKEKADTNTVRVTVEVTDQLTKDDKLKIEIPVVGTVKKGTPAIVVEPLDSYTTGGKCYITKETVEDEKKLVATVGDAAAIPVDGGTVANITIEEKEENALRDAKEEDRVVTLALPTSSDLVFDDIEEIVLEGKRAFADTTEYKPVVKYVAGKDGKQIQITLPDSDDIESITTTTGKWVVKNLQVVPEDVREDASIGDVEVKVSGSFLADKNLLVAKVADYDVALTAKEVVELVSGKGSKEVKLTLKEGVKESLDDKRWAFFELPEGVYFKVDSEDIEDEQLVSEKIVTVNVNDNKVTDHSKMLDLITDKDGNVTGFKVQFEYKNDQDANDKNRGYLDPTKANTVDFVFNIQADSETTGDIAMKVESKAFEVEPVKVATVKAPIEISFDETNVKVGLEKQALGKVTIKETDKGMFQKGELVLGFDEPGVKFVMNAKDLKITTPEGSTLKVEVDEVTKDAIILNVNRTAKEAGEFTIEGIVADIDRTVPEGKIALEVFGDSLRAFDGLWFDRTSKEDNNKADGLYGNKDYHGETNKNEEFDAPHRFNKDGYIVVGTKNTEDLPNAAKAKEIILTVNSTEYTVNGEAKKADAAAFIDANNRTMVPVRFVAEEFGKIEFGTINGVGTVTVFKDGDVLQFQNGSNIMNKNGIAIPMDTTTVIKDGRTYVPFKYVAQGLGINFSFDAATKSITFTNQVK